MDRGNTEAAEFEQVSFLSYNENTGMDRTQAPASSITATGAAIIGATGGIIIIMLVIIILIIIILM